jgi:hypothetical protein
MINDDARVHFLAQLTATQTEYPAKRIMPFDKSSWRLVSQRSIAVHVAEAAPRFTGADLKIWFTFFAMCASDGNKFPLILVATGRARRCHKQFGSPGYPHEASHSSSV